jgi:hypothetical protein
MNWPALKRKRLTTLALAVLLFAASRLVAAADFISESSVGFPVRLQQLVLPGSELEAVPWDDKTLVVVQIEAVYPHGTAFRYDLVYHALEPGEYELRKFLRRKDGTLADDLPPLPVKIKSLLPPGQVRPHQVACGSRGWSGLSIHAAAAKWRRMPNPSVNRSPSAFVRW